MTKKVSEVGAEAYAREEFFCREYLDRLYYFCLRKTGSTVEAEDLAGETAVEILAALGRGVIPDHMDAWVWQIARNRYARWAKRKHLRMEQEIPGEGMELEEIAQPYLTEAEFLDREQIQELRRELSLIKREYRELLVAYYVEEKRISEIAAALSVPEGTVKTNLHRARQRLKEGMEMARTFGKLSYAPEDIEIRQVGMVSRNMEPDIYLDEDALPSKICKNILIEAYCNPVTIQHLSMELGIAAPYLEDYVEALYQCTLMKKHESRGKEAAYETNFVILGRDTGRRMTDKLKSIEEKYCSIAKEYLETARKLQLEEGNEILGHFQDWEEQKWTLALRLADDIQWEIYRRRGLNYTTCSRERPNGGRWDVMGVQKDEGSGFMWIGHMDCGVVQMFTMDRDEKWTMKLELERSDVDALMNILSGESGKVSARELEKLEACRFIRKKAGSDGEYEITFGVYSREHEKEPFRFGVPAAVFEEKLASLWEELLSLADEYIGYCEEVLKPEIPESLKEEYDMCMHSIPYMRWMAAEGLLKISWLKPLEEIGDMAGVYCRV